MSGHVFVVRGDITRIAADAIAYSTDRHLTFSGQLTPSFCQNVPGFTERYRALGSSSAPMDACASTWLELGAQSRPRGVIVAVASGRGMRRDERAYHTTANALECARVNLPPDASKGAHLIALPTFLTGHGGGWHERMMVAEPQLRAAHQFVRDHPRFDVVFVCFTESMWRVFLEARRNIRERDESLDGPEVPSPPAPLINALRRGECVVFAGSGISTGSGLPSWSSLIHELADALGIEPSARRNDLDYFLDLAQWYREEHPGELEALVRTRFTASVQHAHPTLAHYQLASLPVRFAVTTNYDDLLEIALDALRKRPMVVSHEHDIARAGGRSHTHVVKFHGDAPTGQHIVLSRDDYEELFARRPAMASLLQSLLLTQSFFFVGYSLRDPDFRQMYHRVATMLRDAPRHRAFATTFDATTDHPRKQWRNKHLELLDIRGDNVSSQSRALAALLDRLGEEVADDPTLLLATDVRGEKSPHVMGLRTGLLALHPRVRAIGERISDVSVSDVRAAADILEFLAHRGWRGEYQGEVSELFARMAMHPGLLVEEKRSLLGQALELAEGLSTIEQLRSTLRELTD